MFEYILSMYDSFVLYSPCSNILSASVITLRSLVHASCVRTSMIPSGNTFISFCTTLHDASNFHSVGCKRYAPIFTHHVGNTHIPVVTWGIAPKLYLPSLGPSIKIILLTFRLYRLTIPNKNVLPHGVLFLHSINLTWTFSAMSKTNL